VEDIFSEIATFGVKTHYLYMVSFLGNLKVVLQKLLKAHRSTGREISNIYMNILQVVQWRTVILVTFQRWTDWQSSALNQQPYQISQGNKNWLYLVGRFSRRHWYWNEQSDLFLVIVWQREVIFELKKEFFS